MSDTARRSINRVARWAVGAVFIVAAVGLPGTAIGEGKLRHPHSFAASIRTYEMVPADLVFPMAVYLPWLELVIGATLIIGLWRREAVALALGLSAMFLIANATALARGLDVDCGCFGSGYHGSATQELLVAVGLLLALGLAVWTRRSACPDRRPPSAPPPPERSDPLTGNEQSGP